MDTPSEMNARHGDESRAAKEAGKNRWIGVAAVVVAVAAAIVVLARTATGPGATGGRVPADTAGLTAPGPSATEPVAVPKKLPPVSLPGVTPPPQNAPAPGAATGGQ